MGKGTLIEWCDDTVNGQSGCDGCELWNPAKSIFNCYAGTLTNRYAGSNSGWPESFDKPKVFPGRIESAAKWPDLTGKDRPTKPWLNGYPRVIFLDDMGDTFTESLPLDWIAPSIPIMTNSPHIWIFLTKRPNRMFEFFESYGSIPKNFWLMTSVTSKANVGRIEQLMKLRYIDSECLLGLSAEPLLGEINIEKWLCSCPIKCEFGGGKIVCSLDGYLNWIVVGGESGANARPMHPDWARSLRDQCVAANVPFFFKQWGEWLPVGANDEHPGSRYDIGKEWIDGNIAAFKVGKKRAGRLLAGREWNQMPEPR